MFGLSLALLGKDVDMSVSGNVEIFEAGDSGKSVFGPQEFHGSVVQLTGLRLVGFHEYRVVVRADGYKDASEELEIEEYDSELLIGLEKASKNQVGLIVGLTVGGVVLAAGIVVLVLFLLKRRHPRRKHERLEDNAASATWV